MKKRKVIVATHGDFAAGIQNSVRMVAGDLADEIEIYGLYPGASAVDYAKELEKRIQEERQTQYVILTDIYGASVCTAMCSLTQHENVILFAGVNLSLLINLLISYPEVLDDQAVNCLVEEARQGIRKVTLQAQQIDENDF